MFLSPHNLFSAQEAFALLALNPTVPKFSHVSFFQQERLRAFASEPYEPCQVRILPLVKEVTVRF